MNTQPVTIEQLARLYRAANESNSRLDAARKSGDKLAIAAARESSRVWNTAYDAARRAHKRQQKAARRAELRTTMIKFDLDFREATA